MKQLCLLAVTSTTDLHRPASDMTRFYLSKDARRRELAGACVLTASMGARGRFRRLRIRSADASLAGEPAALRLVASWLEEARSANDELITWPPEAMDDLRFRADRHWLFHLLGHDAVPKVNDFIYLLHASGKRAGGVLEACADAGFEGLEVGVQSGSFPNIASESRAVGLYLLLLLAVSRATGSRRPFTSGWKALAGHLKHRPGGPGALGTLRCNGWFDIGTRAKGAKAELGDDDLPF